SGRNGDKEGGGGGAGRAGGAAPRGLAFFSARGPACSPGSVSSAGGGGEEGAYPPSPRRNRSAAIRLRLRIASGNWRNSPGSGFGSAASRRSAFRTSAGSSPA